MKKWWAKFRFTFKKQEIIPTGSIPEANAHLHQNCPVNPTVLHQALTSAERNPQNTKRDHIYPAFSFCSTPVEFYAVIEDNLASSSGADETNTFDNEETSTISNSDYISIRRVGPIKCTEIPWHKIMMNGEVIGSDIRAKIIQLYVSYINIGLV
jgi:hypothetical protein